MPRRRTTRRDARFWRLCLLSSALASLIFGLLFAVAGCSRMREARRIERDFKESVATVLDTRIQEEEHRIGSANPLGTGRDIVTRTRTTLARIQYDANGGNYEGWIVLPGFEKWLVPGQEYPCWYDPADPGSVVLERGGDSSAGVVLSVGLVMMFLGLVGCGGAFGMRSVGRGARSAGSMV